MLGSLKIKKMFSQFVNLLYSQYFYKPTLIPCRISIRAPLGHGQTKTLYMENQPITSLYKSTNLRNSQIETISWRNPPRHKAQRRNSPIHEARRFSTHQHHYTSTRHTHAIFPHCNPPISKEILHNYNSFIIIN
jgi:hypothetical protein